MALAVKSMTVSNDFDHFLFVNKFSQIKHKLDQSTDTTTTTTATTNKHTGTHKYRFIDPTNTPPQTRSIDKDNNTTAAAADTTTTWLQTTPLIEVGETTQQRPR
jgi:spore coat protein CotF